MAGERMKAFEAAQAENEVERKRMHDRNMRSMETLAKEQPSPTIEEIQRAMAPRTPRVVKPNEAESTINNDADDSGKPKSDDDKTDKTSTADVGGGGKYKTRDVTGRK